MQLVRRHHELFWHLQKILLRYFPDSSLSCQLKLQDTDESFAPLGQAKKFQMSSGGKIWERAISQWVFCSLNQKSYSKCNKFKVLMEGSSFLPEIFFKFFTSTLGWSPGLLGAYITCTFPWSNYQNWSIAWWRNYEFRVSHIFKLSWQSQQNNFLKMILNRNLF